MLAAWLERLNLKKKPAGYYAGVHWSPQQLKVAVVQHLAGQWLNPQYYSFAVTGPAQLAQTFRQLAEKLPAHCDCTLVIPPERYMVLQIDKPPVPPEELMLALPWTIKDLVALPDDDLVVDYLDLPLQNQLQSAKVNVVVSSKSWLKELVALFVQNKLKLKGIQPEEWLARNLLPKKSHAVMLVCHQPGQDLSVQIIQNGSLYFSRRLRGFNRLDQFSPDELQQGLFDNLLLELQRSIDFFEGQLKQVPVREIGLWLSGPHQQQIVQLFIQNGFTQVFSVTADALQLRISADDFERYGQALAGAVEPVMAAVEASDEVTP
ncbi:hypothetical protein [Rheinheimera sp.]|uniref:hypothetical protein n=1 Tax=Rheinheimera sp. TaxID=1869214 RepID=UPI00307F93F4